MNGRDLIVYILTNHLEDEPIINNGRFIGFKTLDEVAIELGVGLETVRTLYNIGAIDGFTLGDAIYISAHKKLKLGSDLDD